MKDNLNYSENKLTADQLGDTSTSSKTQTSQMHSSKGLEIDVKLYLQNEIFKRRKVVSNYSELEKFIHEMARESGWKGDFPFLIQYQDLQNEKITLNSQDSFEIASSDVFDNQLKRLNIFVSVKSISFIPNNNNNAMSSVLSFTSNPFYLADSIPQIPDQTMLSGVAKNNLYENSFWEYPSFLAYQNNAGQIPPPQQQDPQFPYFMFWKEFVSQNIQKQQQNQQQMSQQMNYHPSYFKPIYKSFPPQYNHNQFSELNDRTNFSQPILNNLSLHLNNSNLVYKPPTQLLQDSSDETQNLFKSQQKQGLPIEIKPPSLLLNDNPFMYIKEYSNQNEKYNSTNQDNEILEGQVKPLNHLPHEKIKHTNHFMNEDTSKNKVSKNSSSSSPSKEQKQKEQQQYQKSQSQYQQQQQQQQKQEQQQHSSQQMRQIKDNSQNNSSKQQNQTLSGSNKTSKLKPETQKYVLDNHMDSDLFLLEDIVVDESIVRQGTDGDASKLLFQKQIKLEQIKSDETSDECVLQIMLSTDEKCKYCQRGLICQFKKKHLLIKSILDQKIFKILPTLRKQIEQQLNANNESIDINALLKDNKKPNDLSKSNHSVGELLTGSRDLTNEKSITFNQFMDVTSSFMPNKNNNQESNVMKLSDIELSQLFNGSPSKKEEVDNNTAINQNNANANNQNNANANANNQNNANANNQNNDNANNQNINNNIVINPLQNNSKISNINNNNKIESNNTGIQISNIIADLLKLDQGDIEVYSHQRDTPSGEEQLPLLLPQKSFDEKKEMKSPLFDLTQEDKQKMKSEFKDLPLLNIELAHLPLSQQKQAHPLENKRTLPSGLSSSFTSNQNSTIKKQNTIHSSNLSHQSSIWENITIFDGEEDEGDIKDEHPNNLFLDKKKSNQLLNTNNSKNIFDAKTNFKYQISDFHKTKDKQKVEEEEEEEESKEDFQEKHLSSSWCSRREKKELQEYDAFSDQTIHQIECYPKKNLDFFIELSNTGSKIWDTKLVKFRCIKGVFENYEVNINEKVNPQSATFLHLQIQTPSKSLTYKTEWRLFSTTKAGDKLSFFGPTFQIILVVQQIQQPILLKNEKSVKSIAVSSENDMSSKKQKLDDNFWKEIEVKLQQMFGLDNQTKSQIAQFLNKQKNNINQVSDASNKEKLQYQLVNDFLEYYSTLPSQQSSRMK